ncbi:MAG: phosphonate C-P lyase system protein PhnG [Eubacteriaceae bacterium]
MEKKQLFKIMANCEGKKIQSLAKEIHENHKVLIIKEPTKSLTMIKMREPVKSSLFYLGEVMVTETIVEIEGTKGIGVTMGDDSDKSLSMAIIDAGFNKKLKEMETIEKELLGIEASQKLKEEKENALHLKTMVNFNTMDLGETV